MLPAYGAKKMASSMRAKAVLTVRLNQEKREVVDAYLATRRWQIEHIQEGLRQAKAGEFASEDEVAQAFELPLP